MTDPGMAPERLAAVLPHLAHGLKRPLSAILLSADVLRSHGLAEDDVHHIADGIVASAREAVAECVRIKAAVVAGGGTNHRRDLGAAYLIKDNHIAVAGSLTEAVHRAYDAERGKDKGIQHFEVECETLEDVRAALDAGAEELLLDNMDIETLAKAVRMVKEQGGPLTEASGGVTLGNVADIAKTGIDSISVGALTHSAGVIDFSLDLEVRP